MAGIGGSGRQSAARLAAFMADFELFQIEMTKNYGMLDWREDLRKMMRRAGEEGISTVFLFGDHQIKVRHGIQQVFLSDYDLKYRLHLVVRLVVRLNQQVVWLNIITNSSDLAF